MNDSAQSKIAEFEAHIHEMGRKAGKNWRLTALKANDLYIEDVDTNNYYIAEHKTERGKVTIKNCNPLLRGAAQPAPDEHDSDNGSR